MSRGILTKTPDLAVIRQQAEDRLCEKNDDLHSPRSMEEMQRVVHELEVHQIELVMQNEELRQTREELEVSRNRYAELYDFAPVGYFSFDQQGTIQEANLAGARLLGVEREFLVNRPFVSFIADANGRELFSHHLETVLHRERIHICELKLTGKDGMMIFGQLQSSGVYDIETKGSHILCSVIDGTIAKQLEMELQKAYDELEQKNRELDRFNKLFVNRELKMVELKERIRELEKSADN